MSAYGVLVLAAILAHHIATSTGQYPKALPFLVGLPPLVGITAHGMTELLAWRRAVLHPEPTTGSVPMYPEVHWGTPAVGLAVLAMCVQYAHRRYYGSDPATLSHLTALQLSMGAMWYGAGLELLWSDTIWAYVGYLTLGGLLIGAAPVLIVRLLASRDEVDSNGRRTPYGSRNGP